MILLDTHVLAWIATGHPRLGARTLQLANTALRTNEILVSAITFWELGMLAGKHRLQIGKPTEDFRRTTLAQGMREIAVDGEIGIAAGQLPGFHGDPADRIIAATTLSLGATLVTADEKILAWRGGLKTHDARR